MILTQGGPLPKHESGGDLTFVPHPIVGQLSTRESATVARFFRAFRENLPVRAIVCDGDRRDLNDIARRDPSNVERRLLDDSIWHVTAYDLSSGDTVIVRDQPLTVGVKS